MEKALTRLQTDAADAAVNLMPALLDAVDVYVTEGEIINALAEVFGRYREQPVI